MLVRLLARTRRRRSQHSSEENRLWSISKSLTSMLRHGNGGASEVLSSSGWASASRLCGLRYLRNLGAEVTDLVDIVRSQDSRKRRFEMIRDDHGIVYVRAVQGHIVKVVEWRSHLSTPR